MDLLDESKENIQPLRRGRNIGTLNTALLAQTDAEIHNQLMKEKKEFEILVRSYTGDDPLMPWYDYVQWVEQNFPKRGREGNLKILLENCLMQFKDSEQYSQDVRYIDLWTRYISFSDNPLEMYKQVYARGIGTSCALFYQCWAEEHECVGSVKRADQIYIEGIQRNAQPIEDLVSAHTSFQVRISRKILGENPIETREPLEKRTALSTLRAHGRRKNMVDSTRIGNSIKRATPGVLRPICKTALAHQGNNNVQTQRITFYNDENATVNDAVSNSKVKTVSLSLSSQCVNKENLKKPGCWNEGKFKKASSSVGFTSTSAATRNPKFEVHIDENSDTPQTPKIDIVTSNVLKVRKCVYEDEEHIPVAIFEPCDPSVKAMYPKHKVYTGCSEFSLEELRAIIHSKQEKIRKSSDGVNHLKNKVMSDEQLTEQTFMDHIQTVAHRDFQEHSQIENCSQLHDNKEKGHLPSSKIEIYQEPEQKRSFEVFVEMEKDNAKWKEKSISNASQKEKKSTGVSIQKELSFSGCLNSSKQVVRRKECMEQTSTEEIKKTQLFELRDCDQSLTVNTKAIWNDVKGMWVSSPPACSKHSEDPESAQQTYTPFKIFSDISYMDSRQNYGINVNEQKCTENPMQIKMVPDQSAIPQKTDFSNQQTASCSNAVRYRTADRGLTLNVHSENEHKLCVSDIEKKEIGLKHCVSIEDNFEIFCPTRNLTNSEHATAQYYTPRGQVLDAKDCNSHATTIVGPHFESEKSLNAGPGIPFIPSPGLSQAQLAAMKDTEDKENMCIKKIEGQSSKKNSKGILVPSKDVYYVPLERQHIDATSEQENAFSDETCCTETFAKGLVSSTPLVHSLLRTANKDNKIEKSEDVDDTIAIMNFNTKRQFAVYENVPTLEKSVVKASTRKADEMSENSADPMSAPVKMLASAHLSTILEVSDMRKGSSLGSTDGGCTSKSSACDTNQKPGNNEKFISGSNCDSVLVEELGEMEDEIKLFRGASEQKLSHGRLPLNFLSSSFRDDCLAKIIFPSKFHQSHCTIIDKPLKFEVNSPFHLGENVYCIISKQTEKEGCQCFIAIDTSSRQVQIEIKPNSYLWEQYIGEEIRQRIADSSKISHLVTTENIYIFLERHVVISPKLESESVEYILNCKLSEGDLTEKSIRYIASKMMHTVSLLHHCKIVHGNLSVRTFKACLDRFFFFLNDFRNAVDVSLLPPGATFDATEMPLYCTMNARKLSPFQIDYIALADVLHHLIFNESLKVYEERGQWHVSTSFPRNFNEILWKTVFRNLLNNTEIDLEKLSQYMIE